MKNQRFSTFLTITLFFFFRFSSASPAIYQAGYSSEFTVHSYIAMNKKINCPEFTVCSYIMRYEEKQSKSSDI